MSRNLRFGALAAALVMLAIELQAWAFAAVAVRSQALRLYPPDIFARMTDAELAGAPRDPLGWSSDKAPRLAPDFQRPVCGSAFGDSMTYGSEVEDDEVWVHLLSRRMGCTITNFAVPAFGTDQALLRYERTQTGGRFVILGLFLEMVRRSVAASWTFYAPRHPMSVYLTKPLFGLDGDTVRLHPMPEPFTRDTIAAHHRHDYYMRRVSTAASFPHTLAAGRAIALRLTRTDDYRRDTEVYYDAGHPSGSGMLTRRLIERFANVARERGARLAVALIPKPDRLLADTAWERQLANDLRQRGDVCVIALRAHLSGHATAGKLPAAAQGHYTAPGNALIADGVAAGLSGCGILR